MIPEAERRQMLAVPGCGPRVVRRLEGIGVVALTDVRGADPYELMHAVNMQAGRTIWRPPMAILALTNLVEHANARR